MSLLINIPIGNIQSHHFAPDISQSGAPYSHNLNRPTHVKLCNNALLPSSSIQSYNSIRHAKKGGIDPEKRPCKICEVGERDILSSSSIPSIDCYTKPPPPTETASRAQPIFSTNPRHPPGPTPPSQHPPLLAFTLLLLLVTMIYQVYAPLFCYIGSCFTILFTNHRK